MPGSWGKRMIKVVFNLLFAVLIGANATNAFADVYRALSNASFILADEPSVDLWLQDNDEVLACYSESAPFGD
jgi:hypothetical protein